MGESDTVCTRVAMLFKLVTHLPVNILVVRVDIANKFQSPKC